MTMYLKNCEFWDFASHFTVNLSISKNESTIKTFWCVGIHITLIAIVYERNCGYLSNFNTTSHQTQTISWTTTTGCKNVQPASDGLRQQSVGSAKPNNKRLMRVRLLFTVQDLNRIARKGRGLSLWGVPHDLGVERLSDYYYYLRQLDY